MRAANRKVGEQPLREEDRRERVDSPHVVEGLGCCARKGATLESGSVVHQCIETAEATDGLCHKLGNAVEVAQVGGEGDQASGAHAVQFIRQRARFIRRGAVVQGDVVAGRMQSADDGRTDALGAASNECDRMARRCRIKTHGGMLTEAISQ